MMPSLKMISFFFIVWKNILTVMLLRDGAATNVSKIFNASKIDQKELLSFMEPYIVSVFFGLIFVSGIVGNGSLMFIICRYKSMRNLPNIFVFNLALGDLFILFFSVPFTTSIYMFDSWPFGEFVCKASEFAKDTSVGVSVFTLMALSFDRYNIIVNPVQSYVAGPNSKQSIVISLVIIWLASLGLAIPSASFSHILFVWANKTGEWTSSQSLMQPDTELLVNANDSNWTRAASFSEFHVCYPFPSEFGPIYAQIVILARFLLHYFIPLLIIGTLNTITARHLVRSAEMIPGQATLTTVSFNLRLSSLECCPSNNVNNQEARRKVAIMVQCFVALFAVCFLPIHVYSLWFHFDPKSKTRYNQYWNAFRIFGFVLAYVNSCINPIALYFISTNFRKHFNRLLLCGCGNIGESISSGGRSMLRSRSECHRDNNYPLCELIRN